MQIAIIGYGRMGKEVELAAKELNIPIAKIINSEEELKNSEFADDEIAIEFTNPQAFLNNIKILCDKKVSTITGTTGWYNHETEVKQLVVSHNIGFLYSANFSIGINAFWCILQQAAKLMNNLDQYDAIVHETHHKKKIDSPSGTALQTAKIILEKIERKNIIITDKLNRAITDNELHVSSTRGGYFIGEHSVVFDSPFDNIAITHVAKNRQGYALGALKCANWLQQNQKIGFYNMNDCIGEILT